MINDPVGLGAGSYPEPPENEEKTFRLNVSGTFEGYVDVSAKNVTEAVSRVMSKDFDYDNLEMESFEIEDINDCEEI